MNNLVSNFWHITPFDPETLFSLAKDLRAFQRVGHPTGTDLPAAPVISNWSRTLLPHPAIIGSLNHITVLQPVFAITDDRSWALVSSGWTRLDEHVDESLSIGRQPR
ncbi:hypothetical protein ACSSV1_001720 [Labrenzia sp. MBR-25]